MAQKFQAIESSAGLSLPGYSPRTVSATHVSDEHEVVIQYLSSHSEYAKKETIGALSSLKVKEGKDALIYYNLLPLHNNTSYDEFRRYLAQHV